MGDHSEGRLGLSTSQVAGSALAAVSSAVLLSTLGVAGTVIGAAVGSIAATVGSAVYTRTLDVSRQQVAAQAAALRRVTRARDELDEAVAARSRGESASGLGIARAGRELDAAQAALVEADADPEGLAADDVEDQGRAAGVPGTQPAPAGWRAQLSWRRLALLAGVVFLVAMAAITAFELTTGQAVSSYTGGSDKQTGSTIPGLDNGSRRTTPDPKDSPTQTPTSSPTDSATDSPTPDATVPSTPSDGSSEEPTSSPSAEPSETPTDATPSPSLPPAPSPSPADLPLPPSPSASSTAAG